MVVGADIGGTKLAVVLLGGDGTVCHQSWVEYGTRSVEYGTRSFAGIIDGLVAAVSQATEVANAMDGAVAGVGIALAAWLSADRHSVVLGANIGAQQEQILAQVGQLLNLPVVVENDGNATALAESTAAGARSGCCAVFTLGTGVGGGVVVGGRLLLGGSGLAAELGHVPVDPNGRPCVCGGRGCLETVASGPAMALATGARSGSEVVARAHAGDELALTVLEGAGRAIGHTIRLLVPVVAPDVVVLGGSISYAAGEYLLPAVLSALEHERPLSVVSPAPRVQLGRLGPYAGAIGAAHLALALPAPPAL